MKKSILAVMVVALFAMAFATALAEAPAVGQYSGLNWICPYCATELRSQQGFSNDLTVWTCTNCGNMIDFPTKDLEGFDPIQQFRGARFPGIYWYCDACGSFLNKQEGFDDHYNSWECTVCHHVNSIAEDEVLSEGETADLYSDHSGWTFEDIYGDISVGDTIHFGHYEQDNDLNNGPEPIEWIVLSKTDYAMKLVSKELLDKHSYNNDMKDVTWETCDLRTWLNSEFMDKAFYPDEQAVIAIQEVPADQAGPAKQGWTTNAGRTIKDQISIMSLSEYDRYVLDNTVAWDSILNSGSTTSGRRYWWTRSSGEKQNAAACLQKGDVSSSGVTTELGIRPVISIVYPAYDWGDDAYVQAIEAAVLASDGNYEEAMAINDYLGDYWGSKLASIDCRIQVGDVALENDDYVEALDWYNDAWNLAYYGFGEVYFDKQFSGLIIDRIIDCEYQYAVDSMSRGDYQTASALLVGLGDYKDSVKRIRECMDKGYIQSSYFTAKAVNAGLDTGYRKTDPVAGEDPHSGWQMGRFLLSGYTERTGDQKKPTFIKAPGDKLILWFDLEQNIHAIRGNKDLYVTNDKRTYDWEFQPEKSDFGRGALFIEHTDPKYKTNKQMYFDFLAAKETNANTWVEIYEEGTYRVALDYELEKNKRIGADHYNYRIAFEFDVVNGSYMFYLFDVKYGNELEDGAVSQNGFKIDLAMSNAVSITYKRSTLNQNGTGLDVREANSASDHDEFTKLGVYEVTAINKETRERLTKTIFVGTQEELEEYQAVDPSLSRFSWY